MSVARKINISFLISSIISAAMYVLSIKISEWQFVGCVGFPTTNNLWVWFWLSQFLVFPHCVQFCVYAKAGTGYFLFLRQNHYPKAHSLPQARKKKYIYIYK
jgi:hypothetical protein